jgi:hypothetical protein
MKNINIKMVLVGLVVALPLVFTALFYKNDTGTQINSLSVKEQEWLVFMREEEKLARDVYTTLGDKWGVQIFSNISTSEQTHTDAVQNLLSSYNIPDPVKSDEVGVFQSETLQKLYTDLVAEGEQSLVQALKVGAEIEDLDIRDLDIAMSETKNENILQVYANLQKGSRNHLRSFVRQLESRGEKYAPKYISLEEYNSIISSEQERGRN